LIIIFGPSIAESFQLPGLLGLLIGGALVGPNMLSILDDFTAFENIGQLGILYLIFRPGFKWILRSFAVFWCISGNFGLITSSLPFALGTYITLQLGFELKAAILIGSFWASFSLVTYPILKQFGLTKNRAGEATIGASAITDAFSCIRLEIFTEINLPILKIDLLKISIEGGGKSNFESIEINWADCFILRLDWPSWDDRR
jgi:Kef-type K+ transport system membrane component KefB